MPPEQMEVTPSGVREFLTLFFATARAHESGRAFVQLGLEDCAEGTDLFCDTRGGFQLCIRLDWILSSAEKIKDLVFNPDSVEQVGRRWYVYFDRQSENAADVLFRTLREICGCLEGAVFSVQWVNPETWETDREGEGGATLNIPLAREEPDYTCAFCGQPIRPDVIDPWTIEVYRHDERGIIFDCHSECALKGLPADWADDLLADLPPRGDA